MLPIMRYHLGMAHYKNGNKDLAKSELAKALQLDAQFSGSDEARSVLKSMQ